MSIKLSAGELAVLNKQSVYRLDQGTPVGGLYDARAFGNNPITPQNLGIQAFPRSSLYFYRPTGSLGSSANSFVNREIPIGGKVIHLLNSFVPTDNFVFQTFGISPIVSFRPIQDSGYDLDPDAHKMYGGQKIRVPKGFDRFYLTRYSEGASRLSGTGTINWLENYTTPYVFLISEDLEYELPYPGFDNIHRSGFQVVLSSIVTNVKLAKVVYPTANQIAVNMQFSALVNPLTYTISQFPLVGELAAEVTVNPVTFPYSVTHHLNGVLGSAVYINIAGGGVGETGSCFITVMESMGGL